ncbi:MAG: hypothetical protein A4E52_00651 [Pelotomaculum sp. PtaB.Bin013]|nr:MAG: hypothetical protein A4E52_00651 [Pelotomaculum sp. PtaB.Bin013]
MAIPVFLTVYMIRTQIGMKSLTAAKELKITHSFLSRCEDFENVPDAEFNVSRREYLYETLENFLVKYGNQINDPIIKNTIEKLFTEGIGYSLKKDRLFHQTIDLLKPAVLEGTSYGPLFGVMLKYFERQKNNDVLLKKTVDPITNKLLLFAMERQWGSRSVRRKINKIYPEINFEPIDDKNYLGRITVPMRDERKIFWMAEDYRSKRQYFVYLFLYILLKSFLINFVKGNSTLCKYHLSLPFSESFFGIPELKFIKEEFSSNPNLQKYLTSKAIQSSIPCILNCEKNDCDLFILYGTQPIKELYVIFRSFLRGTFENYCIRELV